MMLLGEGGRRKMENKTKTNDQAFSDYYDFITNTHTPAALNTYPPFSDTLLLTFGREGLPFF